MHQQLETEMLTSGIRVDFQPDDWFTADEAQHLAAWQDDFIDTHDLDTEEDDMTDVIDELDPQDPDVDGLFTPQRLLSPDKHVRAGALSIMYTRTRTRMINMSEHERNAYVIAHDSAFFYQDLDTVIEKKKLYYMLYLTWKDEPDA